MQNAVLAGQVGWKLEALDLQKRRAASGVHIEALRVGGVEEVDGAFESKRRPALEAFFSGFGLIADMELDMPAVVDGERGGDLDDVAGGVCVLDGKG